MKKKILLFALLAQMCSLASLADEVEIDGIKYDVIKKGKVATVIESSSYSGVINIPETIVYDGVECKVTGIAEYAFSNRYKLEAISIPNNVITIGQNAFYKCTKLESVTLGNGVSTIENEVFYGCSKLSVIDIPNNVTSIGNEAFQGCSGLTSVTIGNKVTSIGNSAFYGCSSLSSIIIPEGVISIGSYAFQGCSSLTSAFLPNSLTSIGSQAFYNSGLKKIKIPNGVTQMGSKVFQNCGDLLSVWLGSGLTNIPLYTFSGCSQLMSVETHTHSNIEYIENCAFENCKDLIVMIVPESVTSIGSGAFRGCTQLYNVGLNNGLNTIGEEAFKNCTSLEYITIPNTVTRIYLRAFSGCKKLATVVIGNGIYSIDNGAFSNCDDLADVYCFKDQLPYCNDGAFYNSYPEYATLHVPASALDLYKNNAPWSSFGTIVELDDSAPIIPGGGGGSETKVCAAPTIVYDKGKLTFNSETEGVDFSVDIYTSDALHVCAAEVNLSLTYTINVYAFKSGYSNSPTVSATLCWLDATPEVINGEDNIIVNVADLKGRPVLIQNQGGNILLSGLEANTPICIYDLNGRLMGRGTATDGTTSIATRLTSGQMAIIKMGQRSMKMTMQ